MNIEDIIKNRESTNLEFKQNLKPEDKIVNTVIAFANTSGGRIIIGIEDKTLNVVGIENPHKACESLASKIHDSIEPRLLINMEVVSYRNKYLICIEVYPSQLRPHFEKSSKLSYVRIGSTTRVADEALISAIRRSNITKAFDEELFYELNYEDIECTAITQFLKTNHNLSINEFISLGILTKYGDKIVPTTAGVLLFGKNRLQFFPDAFLKVGLFSAIDKEKIIDSKEIKCYLPNAVEEALIFLKKNINIELQIKSIQHQEVWTIPEIALREAVINAIVHTDYSLKGSPILISIFSDRIEIENTALLPWGLTLKDIKSGISKLRNPIICNVFNKIGFIEKWGSGITRMMNACKQAGLEEPFFEEIGARIRVTFYNHKIASNINDDIDQTILDLINFAESLSTNQITNCLNISKRSVINRLLRLQKQGQILSISQSINDPKKRYTIPNIQKKEREKMIKTIWNWDEGSLALRVSVGQNGEIDFIFHRATISDYFVDLGTNVPNKYEDAENQVKKIFLSNPIFYKNIFQKALATLEVQEQLKRKEIAKYIVTPDFFKKDY